MALITKKVYGTEDVLPGDSYKWQFIEDVMRKEALSYGFKEIRTPVFEHTELFQRGVGDTTDVVQKEMYTFETKGGDSVTLRPEGTAGAARALLEHALYNDGLPVKASYFVSCYRYEKSRQTATVNSTSLAWRCTVPRPQPRTRSSLPPRNLFLTAYMLQTCSWSLTP